MLVTLCLWSHQVLQSLDDEALLDVIGKNPQAYFLGACGFSWLEGVEDNPDKDRLLDHLLKDHAKDDFLMSYGAGLVLSKVLDPIVKDLSLWDGVDLDNQWVFHHKLKMKDLNPMGFLSLTRDQKKDVATCLSETMGFKRPMKTYRRALIRWLNRIAKAYDPYGIKKILTSLWSRSKRSYRGPVKETNPILMAQLDSYQDEFIPSGLEALKEFSRKWTLHKK